MLIRLPRTTHHDMRILVDTALDIAAEQGGFDRKNIRADFTSGLVFTKKWKSVRLLLRVNNSRLEPARKAASGRRLNSATWEAHRLFMAALYTMEDGAVIQSVLATYRGKADFERNHGPTYSLNAGSMMRPVAFGDL